MRFARVALADVYIRMREWDNVVAQLDAYLEENQFVPNRAQIRETRARAAQKLEVPSQ